jgi:hypothetical protein
MTANQPNRPNAPIKNTASPEVAQEQNQPTTKLKNLVPGYYAYSLDRHAYNLVLKYCSESQVINESHKMRVAVAYGLERFWGEHLREDRTQQIDQRKREYWKDTWKEITLIMFEAGIILPDGQCTITRNDAQGIRTVTTALCSMSLADTRSTLAVLTQLCDSLVWWTQRLKKRAVPGQQEIE